MILLFDYIVRLLKTQYIYVVLHIIDNSMFDLLLHHVYDNLINHCFITSFLYTLITSFFHYTIKQYCITLYMLNIVEFRVGPIPELMNRVLMRQ